MCNFRVRVSALPTTNHIDKAMESFIDLAIAITVRGRMPANKDKPCTSIWKEASERALAGYLGAFSRKSHLGHDLIIGDAACLMES